MEQHAKNALRLACELEMSGICTFVRYPFLQSHPQHELARRQMQNGSGIVTVEFPITDTQTATFLEYLRLFTLAESLGGVESLVCHPASMTHASIPKDVREAVGISDSLVRFSVGLEHCEDLLHDIFQAYEEVV